MVKLAGAKPVILPDHRQDGIQGHARRNSAPPSRRARGCSSSIRPATRPARVYTPEEVKALGDICVEKNVLIMSDEIYEHLLYDGAFTSRASPAFRRRITSTPSSSTAWPRRIR
jgi:aspartate aminotransferase